MDFFTLSIWILTALLLIIFFIKDKKKTTEALKKAFFMGRGMALSIFGVIFAIGLILALLPPEEIARRHPARAPCRESRLPARRGFRPAVAPSRTAVGPRGWAPIAARCARTAPPRIPVPTPAIAGNRPRPPPFP